MIIIDKVKVAEYQLMLVAMGEFMQENDMFDLFLEEKSPGLGFEQWLTHYNGALGFFKQVYAGVPVQAVENTLIYEENYVFREDMGVEN